ncbi:GTPase IMAP family member 8-like [Diretmus argenteus]
MASQPDLEAKDLRIVLLGSRGAGKSLSGNTILGRGEFGLGRTAQCESRQGEVAGRQVTVVDTPGWWKSATIDETSELVKQELVCCASLSPPGPHAFILVVRMDVSFLTEYKTSIKEQMGLLGERVWSHTVVLFTCGDQLGDRTIEELMEREGEALQWLVGKCGNRCHVFNNQHRGDGAHCAQVTRLLEKIEEMVAANGGRYYEVNAKLIQHVEEMRTAENDRAEQRLVNVQAERRGLRSTMGDSSHLSKLRIVLLGHRTAGKSTAGNTILGKEDFKLGRTTQCLMRQRQVAGRQVTVVDTPGWWANASAEDTSELVKQEIVSSVSLCPPGPHALLLVLRADIAFPNQFVGAILEHLSLIHRRAWGHTIAVFTRGDYLGDRTVEQYIESEGEALQWLVENCGNRYHVFNNKDRGDGTQVTELLQKVEEMVAANGGRHYEIELTVVLLGYRGSGKSSSGNTILGREGFLSGTTAGSVTRQGDVMGRLVTVVDTPGWHMSLSAAPAYPDIQLQSLSPHAFLLCIRVDVSFNDSMKTAVDKHLLPLSERDWSRLIVVFTHGDCLGDRTIEQYVESEGEGLRLVVEQCGNRYHVFNNQDRGDGAQVTQLLQKIEEMVAGNMDLPLSNLSDMPQGSGDGLLFISSSSQTSRMPPGGPCDSEPRTSQGSGNTNPGGKAEPWRHFGPRWNRLQKILSLSKSMEDSEILIGDK